MMMKNDTRFLLNQNVKKSAVILLFLFLAFSFLQAQTSSVVWKTGVCELEGKGLPAQHSYALSAIPQIVAEILFNIDTRQTTEEERKNYLIDNPGLSTAQNELSNLIKSRNQAEFYGKSTVQLDASIKATKKKIESLAPLHVEPALFVDVFHVRGSGKLILNAVAGRELDKYMKTQGIDFLVAGQVYEAEGYFFYTQEIYSRWSDKILSKKTFILPVENLYQSTLNAGIYAATLLAGRPLGALTMTSAIKEFQVSIDGKKTLMSPIKEIIIPAGDYQLVVSAYGYKDLPLFATVKANETTVLDAQLVAKESLRVSILSSKDPVDLYYQGSWLGKTPLDYSTTEEELTMTAKDAAGEEMTFSFLPEKQNPYTVVFEGMTFNASDYTHLKRKLFYDSMGIFLMSFAATTLINGGYSNSMLSDSYTNTDFNLTTEALRYLNYGGIVLTGALGADMLLSLSYYLSAIE